MILKWGDALFEGFIETFDLDTTDGSVWVGLSTKNNRGMLGIWIAYHKDHGQILYYVVHAQNPNDTEPIVITAPKAWELAH